jgi:SEC-C motif-containing protein
MRSRYCAYALGLSDYLLASWHPATRPATLELDAGLRWLGLSVRAATDTGAATAQVEFVARCRAGGAPAVRMHERSRFVRIDEHWFYLDGDQLS